MRLPLLQLPGRPLLAGGHTVLGTRDEAHTREMEEDEKDKETKSFSIEDEDLCR